jgi:hypothetical protein
VSEYDCPIHPSSLDKPLTSLYSTLPTLRMLKRTTSSLTTRPRHTPSRRPLTASPKSARTLPLSSSTSTYDRLSVYLISSLLFSGECSSLSQIADKIRSRVDAYTQAFPSLLEIPSKDHPYDPEKDSVMKRVKKLFGE